MYEPSKIRKHGTGTWEHKSLATIKCSSLLNQKKVLQHWPSNEASKIRIHGTGTWENKVWPQSNALSYLTKKSLKHWL